MSADADTIEAVRQFVYHTFPLAQQRTLTNQDSLLDGGIVDSLGILEIITFLEGDYSITFNDDDMLADDFDSIGSIANLVSQKRVEQNV